MIILFEAERMNETAENKLLKTFEEPPATTVFILVTAAPDELLPTVLSRCQRIDLHALTESTVAAILARQSSQRRWRTWPPAWPEVASTAARLLAGPGAPSRTAFVEAVRSLDGFGGSAGRAAASMTAAAQAAVATITDEQEQARAGGPRGGDVVAPLRGGGHRHAGAADEAAPRPPRRRARTDALMEGLTAVESSPPATPWWRRSAARPWGSVGDGVAPVAAVLPEGPRRAVAGADRPRSTTPP